MRAVFLRRMMVLGVCALGVSALYLVPGLSGRGAQLGVPAPTAEIPARSARPSRDLASVAARSPQRGSAATDDESGGEEVPAAPSGSAAAEPSTDTELPPNREPAEDPATPPRPRSTPFEGRRAADMTPPEVVAELVVRTTDPERARITWAPSRDDAGPVRYRVWLNGYEVAQTSDTETTLEWFNDDSSQQVVVVRAVDEAGNLSRTAALLLTRPESSDASVEPSPSTTSPGPSASPTDAPVEEPAADPTPSPTLSDSPTPAGADRTS